MKMEEKSNPQNWTVQSLPQIINKTNLHELDTCSQLVIFVGSTRSGKSTVANLMSGVPLKVYCDRQDRGKLKIDVDTISNNQDYCQIGHSLDQSLTIIPKFLKTKINGQEVVFCDCPGFNDSRGVCIDIYNSYIVSKIFKKSKKLKIILVITEDSLNEGAYNLINPLNRLSETISNDDDFDELKSSFNLLFAKVDNMMDENYDFYLRRLENIKQKNQKLSVRSKMLIESCMKYKNIGFFRRPGQQGRIYEEDKFSIQKLILTQDWLCLKHDVEISLDQASRNKLRDYLSDLSQSITVQLQSYTAQIKYNYTNAILQQIDNPTKLKQAKQNALSYIQQNNKDIESFCRFLKAISADKRLQIKDKQLISKLKLFDYFSASNQKDTILDLHSCWGLFEDALQSIARQIDKRIQILAQIEAEKNRKQIQQAQERRQRIQAEERRERGRAQGRRRRDAIIAEENKKKFIKMFIIFLTIILILLGIIIAQGGNRRMSVKDYNTAIGVLRQKQFDISEQIKQCKQKQEKLMKNLQKDKEYLNDQGIRKVSDQVSWLKQSGSLVHGAAVATIGRAGSAPFALYSKLFGTGELADFWVNDDIMEDVFFDVSGIQKLEKERQNNIKKAIDRIETGRTDLKNTRDRLMYLDEFKHQIFLKKLDTVNRKPLQLE